MKNKIKSVTRELYGRRVCGRQVALTVRVCRRRGETGRWHWSSACSVPTPPLTSPPTSVTWPNGTASSCRTRTTSATLRGSSLISVSGVLSYLSKLHNFNVFVLTISQWLQFMVAVIDKQPKHILKIKFGVLFYQPVIRFFRNVHKQFWMENMRLYIYIYISLEFLKLVWCLIYQMRRWVRAGRACGVAAATAALGPLSSTWSTRATVSWPSRATPSSSTHTSTTTGVKLVYHVVIARVEGDPNETLILTDV